MKNIKKLVAITLSVLVVGAAGMVYAADIKTPAEVVSALTGKSMTDIYEEREEGKTYGTIANESGKLDEFKTKVLERKKAILDDKVKNGELTKEQADEIYNAIKNNQAICDGTGTARMGRQNGMGFGQGLGGGKGQGMGRGAGCGIRY
ncbi:DUF2680 domain-containing protein [Ruminiclostridium cellulolyticum]|uniref:DUF2680 domain-containing protein n=1 Tax=Ruminiclostridium cellulolyticum (strain ATCC 35319 / DSM 5812 / JCM 6584 / H10) TaxID=394503 RepID=B8I2L5_RUMCH|nr:DUF2680 domain-containing protein [Ruminiclostridium cellulolyticum]ACL76008.1 conserved hypothetical protein [Ruminiclostridium cellulolyticum H10]